MSEVDGGSSHHLESAPPSAKLVHRVLEDEGPLTVSELVDETDLARRTVIRAVDRLEDGDVVTRRPSPTDARRTIVSLSE